MFYIHNVPGRLRVRSEILKRNRFAADSVRISLSTMPGIGVVEINRISGSILVHYNHKVVNHEDIISLLERNCCFARNKANTSDESLQNVASTAGQTILKSIVGTLIGMALSDTPLSFLALFL